MQSVRTTPESASSSQQYQSELVREALPRGARIGGYQVIDVLGRGGFGIVYLALDSSLQRQVAIKEYMPSAIAIRCDDQQVWVRSGTDAPAYSAGMNEFLKEAKLLAQFDHPSLARVHSFWEENRTAYMAMPYYDGPTLAAKLRSLPHPPTEQWLRALLTPLLDALETLHAAMCYHRDISPDNIILLANERPVLLDFGVAHRAMGDKTLPLTELLNPAYAPIEQYSESAALPQGPWTDLYALGGVLHFAVTGQAPARATLRAMADPQRPLSETLRTLQIQFPTLRYSESFLNAIDKTLSVRPQDRPRNVSEFQMLLDRAAPAQTPRADAYIRTSTHIPTRSDAPPPDAPAETAETASAQSDFFHTQMPEVDDDEPGFGTPSTRDEWRVFEDRSKRPPHRNASLWLAGLFVASVGAAGAWWWTENLHSGQAYITMADIPNSARIAAPASADTATPQDDIKANTPDPWNASTRAAAGTEPSRNEPLPTEPTAAGPRPSVQSIPAAEEPATAPAFDRPPTSAAPAAPAPMSPQVAAPSSALPQAWPPAAGPATGPTPGPTSRPATSSVASPAPTSTPASAPARTVTAAVTAPTAAPPPVEPGNPRAVCGARTNFALHFCMQTQCERPKFTTHAQCIDFKRTGEVK